MAECTCGLGYIPDDGKPGSHLGHEATTTVMDCPEHGLTEFGKAERFITDVWNDIRDLP